MTQIFIVRKKRSLLRNFLDVQVLRAHIFCDHIKDCIIAAGLFFRNENLVYYNYEFKSITYVNWKTYITSVRSNMQETAVFELEFVNNYGVFDKIHCFCEYFGTVKNSEYL